MKKRLLKFTLGLSVGLLAATIFLQIANYNRIAWGVRLAGFRLGGLNYSQAQIVLKEQFNQLENKPIQLTYGNDIYPATAKKLGIRLNAEESLKKAFSLGRRQNFFSGISEQLTAALGQYNLSADLQLDENQLDVFITEQLTDLDKPARNAALIFNKEEKEFKIIPAQSGQIINREKLKKSLNNIGSATSILLTLEKDEPKILESEAEKIKDQVSILAEAAPFYLIYKDKTWSIKKEQLIDWLEFLPRQNELSISLNQKKVADFLKIIAAEINQDPINAQLTLRDEKVALFSLAQNGYQVNQEKTAELLKEKIPKQEKNINLIVEETAPKIASNENIEALGLTKLLSRGESNFAGSPKNRVHNIKIGSGKMNDILLKPGEEFSFNQLLGPIEPEEGYLAELVIKKNKTVPEYGGGLCQVSTTVFRAAIKAGLKITERYAHAFPVKYYAPQGFDATIYPPHPDLRFINDTPRHLLIQSKIEGAKLIFEFYGTDDQREVKVIGPVQYDQKPDGSLKAILTQEIWRDNQMERRDVFRSNYKSPDLYPIQRNPLE